jgi:hypothetical protein
LKTQPRSSKSLLLPCVCLMSCRDALMGAEDNRHHLRHRILFRLVDRRAKPSVQEAEVFCRAVPPSQKDLPGHRKVAEGRSRTLLASPRRRGHSWATPCLRHEKCRTFLPIAGSDFLRKLHMAAKAAPSMDPLLVKEEAKDCRRRTSSRRTPGQMTQTKKISFVMALGSGRSRKAARYGGPGPCHRGLWRPPSLRSPAKDAKTAIVTLTP